MNWKERKITYISILISILLHIIFIILLTIYNLFASSNIEENEINEPLELVFENPIVPVETEREIPEKFYELVENPNATGDQPENFNMLSNQSSFSQSPIIQPGQLRAIPGNDLNEDTKEQFQKETPDKDEVKEAYEKSLLAYQERRTFDRSVLTGDERKVKNEENREEAQRGETDQRPDGFNADLVGDFSLSTYAWNWAPYWLAFKRKLNRIWYAPPAYYPLGLIYGYTILRFKISRDGNIFDLEVLRHVGHSSLEQSSVSAINATFPFLGLPDDFEDEYLEITLRMVYPNLRDNNVSTRR
jgi:outer membrane biosynthesis protein TonB